MARSFLCFLIDFFPVRCYISIRHLDKCLIIICKEVSHGFSGKLQSPVRSHRREILNLLRTGPLSAGELLEHFSMTGASLSHHLSILKNAGLIDDEKKGKFIFYTLNTSVLDDILNWMMSLKKGDSHEES